MPYSIKPYGPLRKVSKDSQRKLDLFDYFLSGKESSTIVETDMRNRTLEALLKQDADSVSNISISLRKYIQNTLARSVREGKSLAEAAEEILLADTRAHGSFARARHSAMLIAKTELARARQQAIFDYYTSVEGYQFYTWISVRANNTCEDCLARHNKYKKLTTWAKLGIPPLHCGCKCCLVPGYSIPESFVPEIYEEV